MITCPPPRRRLLLALTLAALATGATAGTNVWTRGEGLTTNIGAIAINPHNPAVLYATSGNAVFKSTNGGNNWDSGTELGIVNATGASFNTVAINPQVPDYVFVGIGNWGVARSVSGGSNWRFQNGSAPYTTGNGFSCPLPSYGPRIYNADGTADDDQLADLGPNEADDAPAGLGGGDDDVSLSPSYCVDTGGVTCHASPQAGDYVLYGPRPTAGGYDVVAQIAGYCTNPSPAHSGTGNTPPRDPYPPGSVTALAFSRSDGAVGFAAYQGRGVYLTNDATRTVFCPIIDPNPNNDPDSDLPDHCSAYAIGEPDLWPGSYRVNWGAGGAALAAGPDSGATIPAATTINQLLIREAGPHVFAASNGQGIFIRSGALTAAGTWAKTSCGFGGDTGNAVCNVQALALSPNEQYLWAGTLNNGIWRADVSAGTSTAWSRVSNVASSHACYTALQNVRALAFAAWFDNTSGTSRTRVYAGSFGHGICYTDDDGASWTALNQGLTDSATGSLLGLYVTSLAVDPLNPIRVYAGTYAGVYSIQIVPGSSAGGLTISGANYTAGSRTLAFGSVNIGQTLRYPLTLTNQGAVTVNFASEEPFSVPAGGFTLDSGCGSRLLPGASCQLFITFAPGEVSNYNATLTIDSDAIEGPIGVTLSGSGVNPSGGSIGTLTVTPSSLAFGNVTLGSTSSLALTLSASGSNIALDGLTVPEGYSVVNTCGARIPAGASCSVTVLFAPDLAISYNGNLLIETDSATPLVFRPLTGTGIPVTTGGSASGSLTITPASLAFGPVAVGSTATQTLTLTATGRNVALSAITPPTGYSVIDHCGSLIPEGASCSLNIVFAPDSAIPYNGNLLIANDSGTPLLYRALSGSGSTASSGGTPGGTLRLGNDRLLFPTLPPGARLELPVPVWAEAGPVALGAIAAPSGFSVSHTCGTSIPAGSSCYLRVAFTPESSGAYQGTLLINDGSGQEKSLQLQGNSADTTTLAASGFGSADALTLLGHYRFGSWDSRGGGYYYVAAIAYGAVYFYDGRNWRRYEGEARPPFVKAGPFTASDVAILNGVSVHGLSGTPIYLGYGSSVDDVVRNGKFSQVYTLP